jgi:AmmeMemoRadiSam system protein A
MLLGMARGAIERALASKEKEEPGEVPPEIARPAGAFVTLRQPGGELRGCVGFTEPQLPLWRTVQEAALGAAFRDSRFPTVTAGELHRLSIQISVLGELTPIRPHDVSVGIHGLMVRHGGRRGLLLPQVAHELGLDREQFLAYTCRKAGLEPDAWREPACQVLAFTAECFGDGDA